MKRGKLVLLAVVFEVSMFMSGYAFSVSRQIPVDINVLWAPTEFEADWADINNDGHVDIVDLVSVAACFGVTSTSSNWAKCGYSDFFLEDKINIRDLVLVAVQFGRTLPSPFPGEGFSTRLMDMLWSSECSTLEPQDRPYCNSLPT